ncbi:DNA-binding response regulator, partial [cyanobacterium TDX16]
MGTRILTVEDDERIRQAVKLALEDEGWLVDEADTGEQALTQFEQEPADVVLIDIMLPGIDGFEVCRSIRRSSDVPIVMVTARADTHDVVAGLEAGADDYLTKPFAPKELSARIRALLRRARTTDPAISHLRFGDLEIVPEEGVVTRDGEEV